MKTNKDFLTFKDIQKNIKIGRSTFQRFIKRDRNKYIENGLIIESKGKKKTLYNSKILEILENKYNKRDSSKPIIEEEKEKINEKEGQFERQEETVSETDKETERQLKGQLEKDLKIDFLTEKLAEKDLYIKEIKEQLAEKNTIISDNMQTMKSNSEFIENLTSRHDTIILTMSKQLEGLNEKMLLLEDKRDREQEERISKNSKIDTYNTIIKASIIIILIIIYFKILYL